jgi:hypothetical protein
MLEPIISHQKEIKNIFKKMEFIRDNFNIQNQKAFFEELFDLANVMKEELEFHFNLQQYGITNQKAKKFVLENMLVKEMLFRMLNAISNLAKQNSMDAFLKFDDFEEILKAYLKKEKGLFIQQLRSVLSEKEIEEIEENIKKLI